MTDAPQELLHLDPLLIEVPDDRLRDVDPEKVTQIGLSISENGQITPIEVILSTQSGPYILNAGAHRLAAVIEAGIPTIMAIVFDGNADQRRLREIDENLYRSELTPYDQASFLAERRAIFERLNGAIKPGKRSGTRARDNLSLIPQMSFFDEVTKKFGLPKKSVTRALKRHFGIAPEIWAKLRGHAVCKTATELDKLAKLDMANQHGVLRLLMQSDHPAKNVSAALRALSDQPARNVDDQQLDRLVAAWRKAGAKAKAAFLNSIKEVGKTPSSSMGVRTAMVAGAVSVSNGLAALLPTALAS